MNSGGLGRMSGKSWAEYKETRSRAAIALAEEKEETLLRDPKMYVRSGGNSKRFADTTIFIEKEIARVSGTPTGGMMKAGRWAERLKRNRAKQKVDFVDE